MNKRLMNICIAIVCMLAISFASQAVAMSHGVSVEISPASGVAETALKISGKGFAAGEEVDILFILEEGMKIGLGTEKVEAIVADAAGVFTANSAIPRMAKPGQYKIEIIGNKGSKTSMTLEVTVKK